MCHEMEVQIELYEDRGSCGHCRSGSRSSSCHGFLRKEDDHGSYQRGGSYDSSSDDGSPDDRRSGDDSAPGDQGSRTEQECQDQDDH